MDREHFSKEKLNMLKVIKIVYNYSVFFLCQVLMPFVVTSLADGREQPTFYKVFMSMTVQSSAPWALAFFTSLLTIYTLRDRYVTFHFSEDLQYERAHMVEATEDSGQSTRANGEFDSSNGDGTMELSLIHI